MFLVIVALSLTMLTFVADALLRPSLEAWATTRAFNVATRAISSSIRDNVLHQMTTTDLFQTEIDEEGNITLIDYDMAKLNELRSEVGYYLHRTLGDELPETLSMPLGLLTGIDFLAGYGPAIPVRIRPVGAVTALPKSDFTSVGINMVNHRLYVYVRVIMRVVAPYVNVELPVEQEVVLTNQVIPGTVPKVFVGIEGLDLSGLHDGQFSLQAMPGH